MKLKRLLKYGSFSRSMKMLFWGYGFSLSLFSFFIDPNFTALRWLYSGVYADYRLLVSFGYVLFIALLYLFYVLILKNIKTQNVSFLSLGKKIAITASVLLFSYPAMLSYDLFNYTTTAKTLFFYKENPYLIMPIEFLNEPFLSYTHAANKLALYGPSWLMLSGIPYNLGFSNILLTLFQFKLFAALFYIGCSYFVWKLSDNKQSLLLFALNPLVLIETFVSGHNDIVMMFFVLATIFLILRKQFVIAFLLFIISVGIKYASIALLPFMVFLAWRVSKNQRIKWKTIWVFAAISMSIPFLLSPLREEVYPWYAIWFLPFAAMIRKQYVKYLAIAFTLGLLLRYIPFMYLGTHFGIAPIAKIILTVFPVSVAALCIFVRKRYV